MVKDPYRYFRIEAQELLEGLSQGLLALEQRPDRAVMQTVLRQAHTLKGASRVVKRGDIGDLAHALEDLLAPHVEEQMIPGETGDRALRVLDEIKALVDALGMPPSPASGPAQSVLMPAEDERLIRVAIEDLDQLLESTFEAHTIGASLRRQAVELGQTQALLLRPLAELGLDAAGADAVERALEAVTQAHAELIERFDQMQRELDEVRRVVGEIRLVSAQSLAGDLDRVARDAARVLGKQAQVSLQGDSTHLDAHVLAGLRKALVHIVRNSVAHGIEDRQGRARSGKPSVGRIELFIRRAEHRVELRCRDDGRGLDLDALRAAAVERRLISPDEGRSISEEELCALLVRGGLSTAKAVTEVSGRGVGLDAARHIIESLRGAISLKSSPGEGLTVEIVVPISLSVVPALFTEVDSASVLIPVDSVQRALRLVPQQLTRSDKGERALVDDQVIPFLPLRRALNRPERLVDGVQAAVLLEAGGQRAVIGVDRLGGTQSVVVRAIPRHAQISAVVSAAALDDEGCPMLIIDPAALIRLASSVTLKASLVEARTIPPLLVIDDSLTTRMLEQSILEAAGYEVHLAVSGEEGLEKARQQRYGAFIVDVEMPGMSGFEFLETVQGDPGLRDIPAILVTSRVAPEDKLRGKRAGARAYIVKSEFHQTELLEMLRRLVE